MESTAVSKIRFHLGAIRHAVMTPGARLEPLRPAFLKLARHFTPEVTVKTGHAKFMVHTFDREISRSVFLYGHHDLPAMRRALLVLEEELGVPIVSKQRHTLIDVGANIGTTSVFALLDCGFERAVALEPSPANLELLRVNVMLNGLTERCSVLPFAVSDRKGVVKIEVSPDNSGDNRVRNLASPDGPSRFSEEDRKCLEVESRSIDDLVACGLISDSRSIAVLWVDVQGYEGYVLKGSSALRESGVPAVVEFWPYALRRAGCLEMFLEEIGRYSKIIDLGHPGRPFGPPLVIEDIESLVPKYPDLSSSDLLLVT